MVALGVKVSAEKKQARERHKYIACKGGYAHKLRIKHSVRDIVQQVAPTAEHLNEQYDESCHCLEQQEKKQGQKRALENDKESVHDRLTIKFSRWRHGHICPLCTEYKSNHLSIKTQRFLVRLSGIAYFCPHNADTGYHNQRTEPQDKGSVATSAEIGLPQRTGTFCR